MSEIAVFIGYSHDSDEHRERVLALSERLRGIETFLDQYVNGTPQGGWPRWMLNQLDAQTSFWSSAPRPTTDDSEDTKGRERAKASIGKGR